MIDVLWTSRMTNCYSMTTLMVMNLNKLHELASSSDLVYLMMY